jgi:enamine deaminase RidA (YjgF/YER057c/UK114 family)
MILSSIAARHGSLDNLKRVVKVTGLVNAAPGMERAFAVVDGASDVLFEIWGDPWGCHARTAYGVAELPRNFPIEVEAIFELHDEHWA